MHEMGLAQKWGENRKREIQCHFQDGCQAEINRNLTEILDWQIVDKQFNSDN